jgi:hypothetical protein
MAFQTPQFGSMKKIDWRKLAAMANPQSVKDLDSFLDNLPLRAGMNGIIAASVIWVVAGAAILMAYTKSVDLIALRKELAQAEALRPTVPVIEYANVADTAIKPQADKLKAIYKSLNIDVSGGAVKITASSTREFSAWRAAIGDLAYGGNSWRVQMKEMCAGRDCVGTPLQAVLSVQQLDIKIPETKPSS